MAMSIHPLLRGISGINFKQILIPEGTQKNA